VFSNKLMHIMTITETYIGLYESLLRSGLNGDGFAQHREEARRLLSLTGIPSHDDENYKYSDFTKKLDDKYQFSLSPEKIQVDLNHFWQCQVPQMDTKVILLSNGWYYEKNDVDQGMPEGIIVCGLREASEKYPQLFRQYYNRYTPGADGFTHLNTMFANDGVFVYVPDGLHVDKTIQLVNLTHGFTNRFVMQRNLIAVGRNASLRIMICDHTLNKTQNMVNNVTESFIGENASLEMYSIQNEPDQSAVIKSLFFHQEAGSRLTNLAFSLHGGMLRNNVNVKLAGEHAESRLYGLFLNDRQQRVDNFTSVDHAVPHCTSNQFYKGILDEDAHGAFQGKILVQKDAQKTEAYQSNKNICLTPTAKMRTKPQLEIYADDVKCSHGATVGQLDDVALFYLRSRGISEKEARLMLMHAFANDIVSKIEVPALREQISGLVNSRLRGEFSECNHCLLNCSR